MNKTRKYFLALMTAMLVFLLAASLYAADPLKTQINGKELDSINDIIAEVNGGKIGIPKYSVLALPADNKNGNLSWHIRTVSQNGNLISLAVGPFRGKMGTLRPCDDLMVSDRFNFFANGSEGTLIGEPKDNSNVIGGWKKGTEDNKAIVRFDWDKVPELDEGAYEFYVVIDPDNKIDEVHEAWTAQTPEGNNNGYFPFGISYGSTDSTQLIAKDFDIKYKARGAKNGGKSILSSASEVDEYDDWSDWNEWSEDTDFSDT